MKKGVLCLVIIVCLSGCATVSETYPSEGKQGYIINCPGDFSDWGVSYKKAGELCRFKGYEILDKIEERRPIVTGGQYSVYGGTSINRTLVIRCRK